VPGVWVVELVEDGQGVLPGFAGGVGITRGVLGVTELDEGVRLVLEVAKFPVEHEGPLVAGDCFGMVAEVVQSIAHDHAGGGFTVAVAEFAVRFDGLPAEGEGLLVVSEQRVEPADIGAGVGSCGRVSCRFEQVEGPLGVAESCES
jgi:hypothetical protein